MASGIREHRQAGPSGFTKTIDTEDAFRKALQSLLEFLPPATK